MKENAPHTKAVRQSAIVKIIHTNQVDSQKHLRRLLSEQGIQVAQSTLSRDLQELNVHKRQSKKGKVRYQVTLNQEEQLSSSVVFEPQNSSPERLKRACRDFLISTHPKQDFLLIKVTPGGGQLMGSFIDNGQFPGIIGTVAGDDTVLIVCDTSETAQHLNQLLLEMANF